MVYITMSSRHGNMVIVRMKAGAHPREELHRPRLFSRLSSSRLEGRAFFPTLLEFASAPELHFGSIFG